MSQTLYVIECRNPEGGLDFAEPQPEGVFGLWAIHGINADDMAQVILRSHPEATLHGTNVPGWPSVIDPRWRARAKYW